MAGELLGVLEAANMEVLLGERDGVVREAGLEEVDEGALQLPLVHGGDGGVGAVDCEEELDPRRKSEAIGEFHRCRGWG